VHANFRREHGNGNSYPRDRIGLDFLGDFFFSDLSVSGVTDETHVVQVHDAEVEVS
jgi:hypothetical protein